MEVNLQTTDCKEYEENKDRGNNPAEAGVDIAEHQSAVSMSVEVEASEFASENSATATPSARSKPECSTYASEGKAGGAERSRFVNPGGIITNGAGYLRRERPDTYHHKWSRIAVGRQPAFALSRGLYERELHIMSIAERLRIVTSEQITRAYFNSNTTAHKHLRKLRQRRYLASLEVGHQLITTAVGRRYAIKNTPLVLDWNGKYLLEQEEYRLKIWNPATVAQINGRFSHILCVSEIWSYIMALARASNETGGQLIEETDKVEKPNKNRLKFAADFYNESESVVYSEGSTGWSLDAEDKSAGMNRKVVVRPDATFVLGFSFARASELPSEPEYSWHDALLPLLPYYNNSDGKAGVTYRQLFLEMETGSNASVDVVKKIKKYNDLLKIYNLALTDAQPRWLSVFGAQLPVILICVRDNSQIKAQVRLWRNHFNSRVRGGVVLVSLEMLAQAYSGGRAGLLMQRCWLDVMERNAPGWKTISDAVCKTS